MPLFPSQGISEQIVQELRTGSLETSALLVRLRRQMPSMTKQGFYKALRQLRQQEMVFLHRREASLNMRWLQRLDAFTSLAEHAYREPLSGSGHFLQMQDGDRISYSFKNPIQVDAFWNHVLYILFDALPSVDRWFAYASHCWFLIGRRKEELALRDYMTERNIRYLFTVGHRESLDRAIAQDFDGTRAQYAMLDAPLFSQRKNHLGLVLNVIGDYVIEAQYDRGTVERIERFYQQRTTINPETIAEIEKIVAEPTKISFTILKNATKARKIAKQLEKRFYFGTKKTPEMA